MLQVDSIRVADQFGLDHLLVTFTIVDTAEDLTNYRFDLYRSLNQSDDFELIASDIQNFIYEDFTVNLYNTGLHYYYKVLIVDRATDECAWSDVAGSHIVQQPDLHASAILQIESIYLQNVIAHEAVRLLKRRHSGQKCDCYDSIRMRSNPNCLICLGTTYVDGYYPSQNIYVNFVNAEQRQHRFELHGDAEDTTPLQLWTSNYPLIATEDLLIDLHNNIYIVTSWMPSYKNYFLIRQTVAVTRVPRSNIAYKLLTAGDVL